MRNKVIAFLALKENTKLYWVIIDIQKATCT